MSWSLKQIQDHKESARILNTIVHSAFNYISRHKNATEFEVQKFILEEFKRFKMVMDKPFKTPIVAFGDHGAEPHYLPIPGKRKLKPGTLVLIDIWGRMDKKNQPYADITWMGYYAGEKNKKNIPASKEIKKVIKTVFGARDSCLEIIRQDAKNNLKNPKHKITIGKIADETANAVIIKNGYKKFILHSTGHALGFASPHGRYGRNLNRKNKYPLLKNVGYTIEPGIYIKGQFGVRSEINFYINSRNNLIVTTPIQSEIIMI